MSHVDDGTLHAYLDGELSPPEARGVEAHLAQCPACRGRLDEERALITRAGELLALATPPDRELPPFRAGDVKPATRLWWRVRLPLAWAATVVLALGIGTYLGSGVEQREKASDAERAERPALEAPAISERARRESLNTVRDAARTAPAAQRTAPAQDALARAERIERKRGAHVAVPTESVSAQSAATPAPAPVPAPAPAPQAGIVVLDGALYSPVGASISTDSARRLLGGDPLAVPGAEIRGIYAAREAGYSAVVIVQQALDSGTAIAVVNKRQSPIALDEVPVTAARGARADTMSPTDHAQVEERAAKAAARLSYAEKQKQETPNRLVRRLGNLEVRISGPLSTDSLQKLLQLARPVEP